MNAQALAKTVQILENANTPQRVIDILVNSVSYPARLTIAHENVTFTLEGSQDFVWDAANALCDAMEESGLWVYETAFLDDYTATRDVRWGRSLRDGLVVRIETGLKEESFS